MPRREEKVYLGNGNWVDKIVISQDSDERPKQSGGGASTPDKPSKKKDSEGKVTKESERAYIHSETKILSGSLELREPDPTIRAKENIDVQGIGSVLSGLYFVEKVIHSFSASGYEQSLELTKKGFGDVMKKKEVSVSKAPTKPVSRESSRPKVTPKISSPPLKGRKSSLEEVIN